MNNVQKKEYLIFLRNYVASAHAGIISGLIVGVAMGVFYILAIKDILLAILVSGTLVSLLYYLFIVRFFKREVEKYKLKE